MLFFHPLFYSLILGKCAYYSYKNLRICPKKRDNNYYRQNQDVDI